MTTSLPADVQVLIIMRHGERADDAPGAATLSVGGAHKESDPLNPPLTAEGARYIEQDVAGSIHGALQTLYGADRDVSFSTIASPFLRCMQTAEAVVNGLSHITHERSHEPIGGDQEAVIEVDYRLSEVCGPIRIKGVPKSEPTSLPSATLTSSVNSRIPNNNSNTIYTRRKKGPEHTHPSSNNPSLTLPVWGEGVQQAQTRFVGAVQSLSRGVNRRASSDSSMGRHALLVTHGDAISSITNALFPSLTVYEVKYGGYMIIEKLLCQPAQPKAGASSPAATGLMDNNRFRIVHSEGVSWLDESFSEEPNDLGVRDSFTREGRVQMSDVTGGYNSDSIGSEDDTPPPVDTIKSLSPTAPASPLEYTGGSKSRTSWIRLVPPAIGVGLVCGLAQAAIGMASAKGQPSSPQMYTSMALLAAADILRTIHISSVLVYTTHGGGEYPRVSLSSTTTGWLWKVGKRFGATFDRAVENEILTLLSRCGVNLAQYHVLSRTARTGRPSDRSPLISASHSSGPVTPILAITVLSIVKTVIYLVLYNGAAMLLSGIVAVAGPMSWRTSCWDAYFNAAVDGVPTWLQFLLFALNMLGCLLGVLGLVCDRVHTS